MWCWALAHLPTNIIHAIPLVLSMKATYGEVAGKGREIYKDPITDDGTKKSPKDL
jgi:hypothetical protein